MTRRACNSKWRDYLTPAEREILRRRDEAKQLWANLNRQSANIANECVKRARADQNAEKPSA